MRSELEETIKQRVEDVLLYVDQKTQGLRNKLTEKIEETQLDLQAIRTSVDTLTKSLLVTDTREHLHEELGLMILGEGKLTKSLIQRGEDTRPR
jgi:hypothetical protein